MAVERAPEQAEEKTGQEPVVASQSDELVTQVRGDRLSARSVAIACVGIVLSLGLALWGFHAARATDPYVHNVLQLSGDIGRGREIFQLNCATCHGLEAAGEVGPDLHGVSERKSRVALIDQVISGKTPPMPQFQPNEKDMADLLSFLETL